jgi:hypothetical protein
MKRNILYYPTIDIPNENWIRNALIYWDEISSIVPTDYKNNPVRDFSPNINFLKDEGFFRPIRPETLLESNDFNAIENFELEFIEIIESREFDRVIVPGTRYSSVHNRKMRIHRDKLNPYQTFEIHNDKVSNNLVQSLLDRELVERDTIDTEWVKVDSKTALLYMSLLAKYIAETDKEATTIGTDHYSYELLNFNANSRHNNISCFSTDLNNVLPTPTPNVSFKKIIDFKNKRKDELLKFRMEITGFENNISKAESLKEVKSHMIEFSEKIELEINELNKCFTDSRILTVSKSLKSLISIKSPTLLASLAVYAGKATQVANLPFGYTMAGLGVMGSVELFHSYINSRNERLSTERNSSFSYLYHAQKNGIIKRTPHNTMYNAQHPSGC